MDWITSCVPLAFRWHGVWRPDSRDGYKFKQSSRNCAEKLSTLQPACKRSRLDETASSFCWAIPILGIPFPWREDPRFPSWYSSDQHQLNQKGIHSIRSQRNSYWQNCEACYGSVWWIIPARNWHQWSLRNVPGSYNWSHKLDQFDEEVHKVTLEQRRHSQQVHRGWS